MAHSSRSLYLTLSRMCRLLQMTPQNFNLQRCSVGVKSPYKYTCPSPGTVGATHITLAYSSEDRPVPKENHTDLLISTAKKPQSTSMSSNRPSGSSRRGGSDRSRKLDVSYLLNDPPAQNSGSASAAHGRGHPTSPSSGSRQPSGSSRPKTNKCNLCGHSFAQIADLRKHQRTVHEGLRPFQCDLCHKSFGEKGNLSKHRKSVHFNERPFQRHVCGSAFAFKDGLARHVQVRPLFFSNTFTREGASPANANVYNAFAGLIVLLAFSLYMITLDRLCVRNADPAISRSPN